MKMPFTRSSGAVLAIALGPAAVLLANPLLIRNSVHDGIVVGYKGDAVCSYDVLVPGREPRLSPIDMRHGHEGEFYVSHGNTAKLDIEPEGELEVTVRIANCKETADFRINTQAEPKNFYGGSNIVGYNVRKDPSSTYEYAYQILPSAEAFPETSGPASPAKERKD